MGKRDKNDKLRWTIPARTDHPDPEKSKTPPQCHSCLFRRLDSESVLGRTKSGRVTLSSKRVRANTNVAKLCRGSECCHSFWWTGSRSFCSQYYFLYGYPIFFFFLKRPWLTYNFDFQRETTSNANCHEILRLWSPLVLSLHCGSSDFKKRPSILIPLCPSSSDSSVDFLFLYCETLKPFLPWIQQWWLVWPNMQLRPPWYR